MTVATWAGIGSVLVLALLLGVVRPRRPTGVEQFYLAARAVPTWRNGAAISSESTSAATCLGVAGLIATHGPQMFWYPIGAAAGFVVLLALVVAPLRRSGTFTVPDFAQWRLGSPALRRVTTCLVLAVGVVYLVAQFHAAAVMVGLLMGLPAWGGWALVAGPAVVVALAGGMGSVTRVQSGQFWLKFVLFAGCAVVLWCTWWIAPRPRPYRFTGFVAPDDPALPGIVTILLACALGTMGLPQVVARVYTAPHGRAARRSIVAAQVLLGGFLLLPPLYGILGRAHVPPEAAGADGIVLLLPSVMAPGPVGDVLTGLLAAAAFAAFLATSCGVLAAVAGAVSSCVAAPGVGSFRAAVGGVTVLALLVTAATSLGSSVVLVLVGFSLSAATFCPLLVLGIWWRRLTDVGVAAGFVAGGGATVLLVGAGAVGLNAGLATACPVAVAVPLSFAVMVVISLVTPGRVPGDAEVSLVRMHQPDDRSSLRGGRSSLGHSPYVDDYRPLVELWGKRVSRPRSRP
ncbi:cation acetate symporter [Nonomuraea sp. NPDC050328]|uniref:sodium:solute symporter family transporter n=1 Tax=Nonomuraea sp. NPDC050328 TaxID=3364361 RepID=UPI0037AC15E7